ncbi:T-cell receptor beta variable [Clarias magur]|nr:T-cell receptor beta variable [Clarias magur]
MRTVLIPFSVTLLYLAGSAVCTVVQYPPDLLKHQDQVVEMTCEHDVKSYDRILWYKHNQDTGFKYMGYLNNDFPKLETEFERKIKLSGNGKNNGSLTINNLTELQE